MIKTSPAKTGREMTKAEAKAVTDRIRSDIDSAWVNITAAYEGKAWKPMGYASWEGYVKAEFDMSRRRSYQLIDQGRVIAAISEAAGESVNHGTQITERDARDLRSDLPAVAAKIKQRVSAGHEPKEVVAETIAAKRQERRAEQAKNDQAREAARAALPASVQRIEQAKQRNGSANAAVSGLSAVDRIAELEEANKALETENSKLKEENKRFAEMKVEFDRGGFAEVIRGKDEVIAVQATRIERESKDKVAWKNSSDMWRKRAEEAGWTNDVVIDINPREAAHG